MQAYRHTNMPGLKIRKHTSMKNMNACMFVYMFMRNNRPMYDYQVQFP